MVTFKKVWPWSKLERFAECSTIRLKAIVPFLLPREFSDFIVVSENI